MSSGLDTDKARALQTTIQKELVRRGYTAEDDLVMADYISIMVINSKTSKQITSELEDLIGEDFDASFTDWLFEKAAKPFFDELPAAPTAPAVQQPTTSPIPTHVPNDPPPSAPNGQHNNRFRNGPPPARSSGALFQQAISATAPTSQKRPASMRSPSPSSSHPAKARRTDLPDRPRAMRDEQGNPSHRGPANNRSLLERVGGPAGSNRGHGSMPPQEIDRIQAQIDAVTHGGGAPMDVGPPMFFPPGGMDMSQVNPMMLQEMMATQMMLMQQMSMAIGAGMPPPPMPFGMNGFQPQPGMNQHQQMPHRGRGGRGRGGWSGPGRGGHVGHESPVISEVPSPERNHSSAPQQTSPQAATSAPPTDRSSSPTPQKICKFGTKCTNGSCRFSHPSPAATAESGLVLSAEACEQGRNCKDKDCTKSHPSAGTGTGPQPSSAPPAAAATTPCKFGNACTRQGCAFVHPRDGGAAFAGKPCRFAVACTRADCPFSHPPGRVLPSTFHRGLSINPSTSTGQFTSHNRSMSFKPNPTATPFTPAKPAAGPEAGGEEKQPAEVAV